MKNTKNASQLGETGDFGKSWDLRGMSLIDKLPQTFIANGLNILTESDRSCIYSHLLPPSSKHAISERSVSTLRMYSVRFSEPRTASIAVRSLSDIQRWMSCFGSLCNFGGLPGPRLMGYSIRSFLADLLDNRPPCTETHLTTDGCLTTIDLIVDYPIFTDRKNSSTGLIGVGTVPGTNANYDTGCDLLINLCDCHWFVLLRFCVSSTIHIIMDIYINVKGFGINFGKFPKTRKIALERILQPRTQATLFDEVAS